MTHEPSAISHATIKAASLVGARIEGCTCNADVDLAEASGILHATVRHDAWCPLLQRRAAPWN